MHTGVPVPLKLVLHLSFTRQCHKVSSLFLDPGRVLGTGHGHGYVHSRKGGHAESCAGSLGPHAAVPELPCLDCWQQWAAQGHGMGQSAVQKSQYLAAPVGAGQAAWGVLKASGTGPADQKLPVAGPGQTGLAEDCYTLQHPAAPCWPQQHCPGSCMAVQCQVAALGCRQADTDSLWPDWGDTQGPEYPQAPC